LKGVPIEVSSFDYGIVSALKYEKHDEFELLEVISIQRPLPQFV